MVGLVCLAISWGQDFVGAKPPIELTDLTFAMIRSHASPTAEDLAFQSLDWKISIYDGLVASKKEDKPMLLWMYFGDPRGHC